ncbi:hypothetical protein DPMN_015200, partial [Dreissena polymorpha]
TAAQNEAMLIVNACISAEDEAMLIKLKREEKMEVKGGKETHWIHAALTLPDEEEILSSPEHAELGLPQSLAAKPALGPALNQIDLSGALAEIQRSRVRSRSCFSGMLTDK